MTLCYGAKETAHKSMSVMKQKSITSFNLGNYYVVGHNMFEEPNVFILLMTPMLLFHLDESFVSLSYIFKNHCNFHYHLGKYPGF